jgi:hypothetical protein
MHSGMAGNGPGSTCGCARFCRPLTVPYLGSSAQTPAAEGQAPQQPVSDAFASPFPPTGEKKSENKHAFIE